MELTQVKGNTWVAEGTELIPFYKLDGKRCVLLDSGLLEEREELEAALGAAGLTPAGVLCSHAHVDHCGNNRYFTRITQWARQNDTASWVRLLSCILERIEEMWLRTVPSPI